MPAGREGPMVHAGAIIASVASRIPARWGGDFDFANDYDRRNFVSMGAAAGVAAAFNAPIGGTLFALEEVSSFWNPQLTMSTFCIVTIAAGTAGFWKSGMYGRFDPHGLVLCAEYDASGGGGSDGGGGSGSGDGSRLCLADSSFAIWELLPFLALGVLGGLAGALFNGWNERVTKFRKRMYRRYRLSPRFKVVEAVASIWLVLALFFWLPFAFGCRSIDDFAPGLHVHKHDIYPVAWQCTGSNEYNEMATLLLQPTEGAIKQLFSRSSAGYLSLTTTFAFVLIYITATALIYGIAVPAGLFVPCMLMGGGMGRFLGQALHEADVGSSVDPGLYALMGAAGMLGGVTRMTISLSMIVVEVSGDINLLLPVMFVILVARLVGKRFNESVSLRGTPR